MILNLLVHKYKTSALADKFRESAFNKAELNLNRYSGKNFDRNTTVFQRLQRERIGKPQGKTNQNADIEHYNLE